MREKRIICVMCPRGFGLVFSLVICLFFTACATKPGFDGRGDLCGLVIDENNAPVKDFIVEVSPAGAATGKLGGTMIPPRPVLTNESGLFVFYGLPSGVYLLSGARTGYLRISENPYRFDDRTKIICLQTKSFRAAVLCAEELISLGQTEEAGEVLDGICCESGSPEEVFFKEYISKLKEVKNEK